MIKLHGKPVRVNKASQDKKSNDVGANLFVGNLDSELDEKLLYDTFSAFGVVITTPEDHARPRQRQLARVRIRVLRLVRSRGRRDRGDERAVFMQPTDIRHVRV